MATVRTVTVKPSGGNYTSLSNAEAGEQGSLVALDRQLNIECYAMTDSTAVMIDGSTTDATRYISIYTPAAERPATMVWDAAKYVLQYALDGAAMNVADDHVRFEGIQFQNTAAAGTTSSRALLVGNCSDVRVTKCILRGGSSVIRVETSNTCVVYLINCFAYGDNGALPVNTAATLFVNQTGGGGQTKAYSCTFVSPLCTPVWCYAGTLTVKNCYAATGTAGYAYVNGGTLTQTTCASSDLTSATVGLRSIAYSAANFLNVTPGSENLHLTPASALRSVGTNTTGDASPLNFTDDITGTLRPATWHVGASQNIIPRTATVKSAAGDYTTLSNAEAGEQGDLVAMGRQLTLECYGIGDTTRVTVDGSTTDAAHWIKITPAAAEAHRGTWCPGGKYRLTPLNTYATAITIQDNYVSLIGLQIENRGGKGSQAVGVGIAAGTTGTVIDSCLVFLSGAGTPDQNCCGIKDDCAAGTATIINNVIAGGGTGYWTSTAPTNGTRIVYNNTILATIYDISMTGLAPWTAHVKNNLLQGTGTNYRCLNGTFTTAGNITRDTSSPQVPLRSKTVAFLNTGWLDYHLAITGTDAIGAGSDLSADAVYPFAVDFQGTPRAAGAWDVGASQHAVERMVTVKSAGGTYTSLPNAEAAEQCDFVALGRQLTIECYGISDAYTVIDGSTTSTNCHIKIKASAADAHGGKWDATKYRISNSNTYAAGLNINDDHVRLVGLQVENRAARNLAPQGISIASIGNGGVVILDSCIVRLSGTGTPTGACYGINDAASATYTMVGVNCVSYGALSGWYSPSAAGVKRIIYNCTLIGTGYGINTDGSNCTLFFTNLVLQGATAAYNKRSGGGTILTCLTNDTTSPTVSLRSITPAFVDAANGDYHLAAGDVAAMNVGTDLAADAQYPFAVDFAGTARPAGTWDVGAHEYVSTGFTGSGGSSFDPVAAGTGTETFTGAGNSTPGFTTAGTGDSLVYGGSSVFGFAASGTGTVTFVGAGGSSPAIAASGTGKETFVGSGGSTWSWASSGVGSIKKNFQPITGLRIMRWSGTR